MSKSPATILIVDDSEIILSDLSKSLEANGFVALTAKSGNEALDLIDKHRIDLIICDITMPYMDGMTFIKRVHEKAGKGPIPTIMLTTEGHPDLKGDGKTVGVQAWALKPYNERKMVSAIKKVLSSR